MGDGSGKGHPEGVSPIAGDEPTAQEVANGLSAALERLRAAVIGMRAEVEADAVVGGDLDQPAVRAEVAELQRLVAELTSGVDQVVADINATHVDDPTRGG